MTPRTVFVALLLAVVAVAGCLQDVPEAVREEPVAIYITDAPVNVSRLDVGVAYVTVGGVPLEVLSPSFDLASLQGPEDALLLAEGLAPPGDQPVEIAFAWGRATVDNQTIPVDVTGSARVDGLSLATGVLVDIDLAQSLHQEAGGLTFSPTVKDVYVMKAEAGGEPGWVPAAAEAAAEAVGRVADGNVSLGNLSRQDGPKAETSLPGAPVGASAAGEAVGWLVSFHEDLGGAKMRQKSESAGLVYVFSLKSIPVAYVLGTELQVKSLLAQQGVDHAERETALAFHDAESRLALRMPELMHPLTGLRDADGDPIDGRGVGVAVVDTGIHATHTEILYEPLWDQGRVAMNLKVESQTFTDLPSTDTTSGHGTHVTGIISAQGVSDPERTGIAPGATIYGLGVGEAATIVWAAQAFDWILQNHDQVDPPIRVVTNSWGSDGPYNPDTAVSRLTNKLVKEGITVVFSAGNEGGDGSEALTSAECQIPTSGVICVAAYDDMGSGTRDGQIAPYSSRGDLDLPGTWPDISAPGTQVLSARPPVGTTTGFGTSLGYVELSGTSQAAPHVAGVAALMLQADPTLEPRQVEAQIKATAHKFTHGGAYAYNIHHAKGAGLVDAYAAVEAVS